MDEEKKILSSVKKPGTTLVHIDSVLEAAYQAPRKFTFSANELEKTIQKAVLYHRLMEDSSLRSGKKSPENDARYEKLAAAVTEGRDPVAEFIKAQTAPELQELLVELMVSGKNRAWFEDMLTRSEEKKAEAAAVRDPGDSDIRQMSNAFITRELGTVQSSLFRSLAENRNTDIRTFFETGSNAAMVRRLLAVRLHQRQLDHELAELQKVYGYESPAVRAEQLKNRPVFSFEAEACTNTEAYLERLENSQEVMSMLQRLAQCGDLDELSKSIIDPPYPEHLRRHDSLLMLENKLMPDAILAFLNSEDAPEPDSEAEKALLSLPIMNGEELAQTSKMPSFERRLNGYRDVLKKLEDGGLLQSEGGKKLKQELREHIERLEDVLYTPDREKINFNFRPDTLIDYIDPSDPDSTPMDAIEAREKLIRGAELEQKTFNDDEFVGASQKVTMDKKTGLINKGPEKLITRVVDLSKKTETRPQLQLEELRKIKEVLKKTDPFYVKNSESYTNVLNTLNKIIKTQESMSRAANVRQVAELRALYAELDSNAAKYVSDKSERTKVGDERAQIRMDAVKTLQSLTNKEHFSKIALKLYDEQRKLEKQREMVEPCKTIINKWKRLGTPTTPKACEEFKKDFNALYSRLEENQNSITQLKYFKMGIAEGLDDFVSKAKEVQKTQQEPDKKPDANKLERMKKFKDDSMSALNELYAMEPTGADLGKQVKKEELLQKTDDPKKVRNVL